MSYFHCGNGYPDRCNGYVGPLDERVCTNPVHKYDERGVQMRCVHGRDRIDHCVGCGRHYKDERLVGPFITEGGAL